MNKLAVTLLAALRTFNVPQRAGMSATPLLKPKRYNKYETHRGNARRECARRVLQMARNKANAERRFYSGDQWPKGVPA